MAQLSKHHRELNDDGIGKCSVPMFCGGMDAGFCNGEKNERLDGVTP